MKRSIGRTNYAVGVRMKKRVVQEEQRRPILCSSRRQHFGRTNYAVGRADKAGETSADLRGEVRPNKLRRGSCR